MMNISLGIADFIILFLGLHGFILSVLLAYSAKKIKNNYWVAALIFVVAETVFVNEIMKSGYWDSHTNIIPFVPLIRLAIGPLLYFYTRSLARDEVRLRRKDYWHFAPLLFDAQYQIIALLYVTRILAIPAVQHFYFLRTTQDLLFRNFIWETMPAIFSVFIYLFLSYRMIRGPLLDKQQSPDKLADLKRIRNFIYAGAGLTVLRAAAVVISFYTPVWYDDYLNIPITVLIYWLGMAVYRLHSKMTTEDVLVYEKSPGKVYFTDVEASTYCRRLIDLMNLEKTYLDPSLKMDMLAAKLLLTERSVSNLLNQHMGKNFNDFVNEYRVEEAKRKLTDPSCQQFTTAAIGFDCGFNSLATFQRCFKQFTGVTPGQYQKLPFREIMLKS